MSTLGTVKIPKIRAPVHKRDRYRGRRGAEPVNEFSLLGDIRVLGNLLVLRVLRVHGNHRVLRVLEHAIGFEEASGAVVDRVRASLVEGVHGGAIVFRAVGDIDGYLVGDDERSGAMAPPVPVQALGVALSEAHGP